MHFNLMPFFAELMITVEKQEGEREKEREALTYNMESLVEHANPLAYHDAHDVRLLPLLLHCEHVLHWSQDPIQSHDGQA